MQPDPCPCCGNKEPRIAGYTGTAICWVECPGCGLQTMERESLKKRQSSSGIEGYEMAQNNEQLLDLYDIISSLNSRLPKEARLLISIDPDGKMYLIFNFPDEETVNEHGITIRPAPFQLTIENRKDILDMSASDIMHITLARLHSYINDGFVGNSERLTCQT